MKTHELARKLLEGPDVVVAFDDGTDLPPLEIGHICAKTHGPVDSYVQQLGNNNHIDRVILRG